MTITCLSCLASYDGGHLPGCPNIPPGVRQWFQKPQQPEAVEPGRVSGKVCPECKSHQGEPHEPWCNEAGAR